MTISPDDVRRLLGADDGSALVLVEGRVEVVSGDAAEGALEVVTRADLVARTGRADLTDQELAEQAAALDLAVAELGG
ncbi:hypothetical protein [Mycolicibacterium sp.]|uniref:hypothetical protein n=1 Tax=Mycolicibacterium sp. TaxID=2320850 RepID=UPI003D0BAF9A